MPIRSLPENPNAEQARKNAKALRDLVRAGDEGAIRLVREHHPRLGALRAEDRDATSGFRLADAQLTLARHHGFPSWPRLVAYIDLVDGLSRSPHRQPVGEPLPADDDARADELLRLACLTYGADDPDRPRRPRPARRPPPPRGPLGLDDGGDRRRHRGRRAPRRRPGPCEPPGRAVRVGAAALRDVLPPPGVRRRRPAGEDDPVGVVRTLLAHGADPNAGYMWEGGYPFTALTGAIGRGEQRQPPHPHAIAIARLLLEAGADANDSQAVYDTGLGDRAQDDTEVLELLLDHGLGTGDGGPWHRRLAPHHPSPADLVAEALAHAAANGLVRRTEILLARGADPDRPGAHPAFGGLRPYRAAVRNGHTAVAALLAAAGADTTAVDDVERLVGACLAGDREAVGALQRDDPSLAARAVERDPDAVVRAAEAGHADGVRLAVELGWDVNARPRGTALHEAAWRGDLALARLLVALGADPTVRDTSFDAPPEGWAAHGGHDEVAAYLRSLTAPS